MSSLERKRGRRDGKRDVVIVDPEVHRKLCQAAGEHGLYKGELATAIIDAGLKRDLKKIVRSLDSP